MPSLVIETTTLLSLLQSEERFSIFSTLLKIAGFETYLECDVPLTIFAPINSAFRKLSQREMDRFLTDPDILLRLVAGHIVSGRISIREIKDTYAPEVICGKRFRVADGRIEINGAKIISGDAYCLNGIVHAINAVLIPPVHGFRPGKW